MGGLHGHQRTPPVKAQDAEGSPSPDAVGSELRHKDTEGPLGKAQDAEGWCKGPVVGARELEAGWG